MALYIINSLSILYAGRFFINFGPNDKTNHKYIVIVAITLAGDVIGISLNRVSINHCKNCKKKNFKTLFGDTQYNFDNHRVK